MRTRRLLTVGVLLLAMPFVYADDASKAAKVEEFFKLAKMDETLKQSMDLVQKQIQSNFVEQLTGAKLTPAQRQSVDDLQAKVMLIVTGALAWEKLKPGYVKVFADAYTEAQLDDLIAFYKSPTGQAMVEKGPDLMSKSGAIAQQKIAEIAPQIQELLRQFAAQAQQGAAPK